MHHMDDVTETFVEATAVDYDHVTATASKPMAATKRKTTTTTTTMGTAITSACNDGLCDISARTSRTTRPSTSSAAVTSLPTHLRAANTATTSNGHLLRAASDDVTGSDVIADDGGTTSGPGVLLVQFFYDNAGHDASRYKLRLLCTPRLVSLPARAALR